jgi:hypothetical protein
MAEKLAPHDIDAEEAVCGSLLIDGQAIELIDGYLFPDDFYNETTRLVYKGCCNLRFRSETINQISVAHELNTMGKLELVGGAAYLSHLISIVPTSLDIESYASIVRNLSGIRRGILAGQQIVELGYNSHNFDEFLDKAKMLIDGIQYGKQSRRLELGKLKIVKTSPPYYEWNVNGQIITFSQSEVISWNIFRKRVMGELDFIPIKPKNWEDLVNHFLQQATKEVAPIDTSPDVEAILLVKQRFAQRGEGWEVSDLRQGCYVTAKYRGPETKFEEKEYWVFQRNPLLRFLKKELGQSMTAGKLWTILLKYGAIKLQKRIGKEEKQPLKLWAIPSNFATDLEFEIEKQEKLEIEPIAEELGEEELPDI